MRERRQSLTGAYIADLDVNPDFICDPAAVAVKATSDLFPTLPTHSTAYSWVHKRHATPRELLVTQGVPCGPVRQECSYSTPWQQLLSHDSPPEAKHLEAVVRHGHAHPNRHILPLLRAQPLLANYARQLPEHLWAQ
eukprot:10963039-Alexandrium_andersonii.AAC.2